MRPVIVFMMTARVGKVTKTKTKTLLENVEARTYHANNTIYIYTKV